MPSYTPIIVGVSDIVNRSTKVEDAIEPLHLMTQAIRAAITDANTPNASKLQSSIDSIDVVNSWTWPYSDLPSLISSELDVNPKRKYTSPIGGNQPGKLLDEAARRIARGESKVAVLTGGEALASLRACAAAGKIPPAGWTKVDQNVESVFSPTTRGLGENLGAVHSIGAPIHVYPLYENGFRAHRGQSIEDNNTESARMYAEFAKVAERNPLAWSYGKPAETEASIGTVTQRNRMICFPYPLLMNAFNAVNISAAVLLTSAEFVRDEDLSIPEAKWIYVLGGAGTRDSYNFWERPDFHSSPSISRSLDAGIRVSGLTKDQIDLFDLYSCFPIIPKLACRHLGLPFVQPSKPITLLGGLTSFGGAGNNYSMHAVTEMVSQLRQSRLDDNDNKKKKNKNNKNNKNGLILANGGVATYQHVVVLSTHPRPPSASPSSSYPDQNPLPDVITDVPVPAVDTVVAEGAAVVETYTVEFARDGTPLRGHVVGRLLDSGHRFLANHADTRTLEQLSSRTREPIGRKGWVRTTTTTTDGEQGGGSLPSRRNLFSFGPGANL